MNARASKLFSAVALFFVLTGGLTFYYLYNFHEAYPLHYKIILFFSCAALSFCFVYLFPVKDIKKDGLLDRPVFVAFFILAMVLINRANVLRLPFYWDEQWTIGHADVIFKNHLWPFSSAAPFDTGHPFFYFEFLAFLWNVFGQKIIVSHLAALVFSWMPLFYTYLIGRDFFKDARIGFFAAVLFFYSPTVFTHFGTVVLDVPLAAFFLASTYSLLRKKYLLFGLFSSFAVLTKATGIVSIGVLLFLNFIILKFYEKDRLKLKSRDCFFFCLPFIVYVAWFIGHYYSSGILLYSEIFERYNGLQLSGPLYVLRVGRIFEHFFLFGNVFLTIIIFYHFIADVHRRKPLGFLRIFFILFLFVVIFSFALVKSFSARWLIPFYPFFYFLGVLSLVRFIDENKLLLPKVVFYLTVLFSLMRYDVNGWALDSVVYNNEYIDAVKISQDAARYVELNFSDKRILTSWPFMAVLRYPALGYVKKPLRVVNVKEKFDIFVYDKQALKDEGQPEEEIFLKNHLVLLKRFERNAMVIEIFDVL
jgi:hypothetical protein